MKKNAILILFIIFTINGYTQKVNTDKSKVTLKIRNVGLMVKGSFEGLQAEIKIDDADLFGSMFNWSVESKTLNTKNKERDEEWKTGNYFNTEEYSQIIFRSDTIEKTPEGYNVLGKFKIKNRSTRVKIPVIVISEKNKTIFKGQFFVIRRNYDFATANMQLANKMTFVFEIVIE